MTNMWQNGDKEYGCWLRMQKIDVYYIIDKVDKNFTKIFGNLKRILMNERTFDRFWAKLGQC